MCLAGRLDTGNQLLRQAYLTDGRRKQESGIRRIVIAVLSGWLVSWLGVAALITLSIAWPHNPIPRVLLAAWAVLAAVSFAIPGASLGAIRGKVPVLVLAVPFVPLARAAIAVWPYLPRAGGFRRHRWARRQRKQSR